jgi:hypothetical protein
MLTGATSSGAGGPDSTSVKELSLDGAAAVGPVNVLLSTTVV